jgi:hypothetical protein
MTASAAFLQHAEALLGRRDVLAALAAFNRAEEAGAAADPCAGGRWMAHMLAGNFASAWRESDLIRQRGAPDPHRFWAGDDLRGKRIILRCLHGYGDAVQFLRYAPSLRALASHLVVEVPPAMLEMAPYFVGVDDVITWGADAPAVPPKWNVQVEVMELPYLFRTEAHELPVAEGYLHLPENMKRQAARAMGSPGLPRVGIVWAAGEWNADRSLPLALLEPLLQTSPCEFWNLQGGRARQEPKPHPNLRDAACFGDGILRLAALISQLDLVITVDTLAAHLAGVLDKPTWVLLQHAADWRWMLERSDSPWYTSLRLFRQPSPGDWQTALACIRRQLARWLAEKAA